MINVKRIAVLGMLLSAGACSRLPNVPTAYSALPRTPVSVAAVASDATTVRADSERAAFEKGGRREEGALSAKSSR